MTTFYLASFERDRQMTIVCDAIGRKLLGHASSTYTVAPAAGGSRVVLKLAWIWAAGCSALRRQRRQWTGGQTPVSAATRPEDAASRSAL
jgi:hypothetical protein